MGIKIARNNPNVTMPDPEPGDLVVVVGHNKGEKKVLEIGDVAKVLSVSNDGTVGIKVNDLPYASRIENIRPMLSGEKVRYHFGQEQMKVKSRRLAHDTFAVIKYGSFIKEAFRETLQERAIVQVVRAARSLPSALTLISFEDDPEYYAVYTAALRPATERDMFLYHIHGKYALIEQDVPEESEEEDEV